MVSFLLRVLAQKIFLFFKEFEEEFEDVKYLVEIIVDRLHWFHNLGNF